MSKRLVKKYYNEYGIKEWKRLARNPFSRLEFETTLHFLKKYLPKRGLILDAGGGPGRYSITLAKIGYDVILLDYSPNLLKIAKRRIKKEKVSNKVKDIIEGTVTDLSQFKNNTFDAVLCLGGIISHLLKRSDRDKGVSELRRVAKKNAPIFISVIGRLAVIKKAPLSFPDEIGAKYWDKFIDTGNYYGGYGFAPMHGFLLEDLKELVVKNRLKPVKFIGLQGLSSSIEKYINKLEKDTKQWKVWLKTHYKTCEIPSVVDTSNHILCICKEKGRKNEQGYSY